MVRVSDTGTVMLPLAGEVQIGGMDERTAAHTIEAALIGRGMLLHPQVTVLVAVYMGQDVSVLGEVTRPGVYPFTAHHRLLDLISAASGVGPSAGSLVTIVHRDDPRTPNAVVLDPTGVDTASEHNPELEAGRYGAGESRRTGIRNRRCDPPWRIPGRPRAEADSGAGSHPGLGAGAECISG